MEVGKMFVYVSFPISIFYYFNNPDWYEAGIEEMRSTWETEDIKRSSAEFFHLIRNYQREEQKKHLENLEKGKSSFQ